MNDYALILRQRRYLDLQFAVETRSPQLLAAELRRAAEEHHLFEEQLGQKDEDWAGWYARFLLGWITVDSDSQELPPDAEVANV